MNTTKKADCKPKNEIKNGTNPCLDNIPKHWKVQRLGTSVKSENNGVWGDDPDGTNDIVCIRVADFDRSSNRIRTDKLTLRSVKPSERSGRLLRKGDLLLEKSGGGEQQPVGALVMYNHDFEAVCSNFVARLVVREGYDPTYLTYLHRTLYATGVNKRSIKQTTGIQNIDSSSYLSERVGIPPIEEQAAIVRYLDNAEEQIQAYISGKQRLIALLEEQRQAVTHQAVTRGLNPNVKLRPSGVEWLGDVPEHWEIRRLKSLVSIQTGGQDTINRKDDGKYPFFVRSQTVEKIDTWSYDGEAVLTAGDGAGVGKVFHYFNGKFDFHQRVYKFSDFTNILGKLFFHSFKANLHQVVLQGTAKSTVDSLRLPMLQNFPIPVPPMHQQAAIVDFSDKNSANIDISIDLARRQIELLQEYRTRLIADVVTGKLDVRKAAAELPDLEPVETTD